MSIDITIKVDQTDDTTKLAYQSRIYKHSISDLALSASVNNEIGGMIQNVLIDAIACEKRTAPILDKVYMLLAGVPMDERHERVTDALIMLYNTKRMYNLTYTTQALPLEYLLVTIVTALNELDKDPQNDRAFKTLLTVSKTIQEIIKL